MEPDAVDISKLYYQLNLVLLWTLRHPFRLSSQALLPAVIYPLPPLPEIIAYEEG